MKLEKELREYLHQNSEGSNKEAIQSIINAAYYDDGRKHRTHRTMVEIALDQIWFIGWRTWLYQGLFFCLIWCFELSTIDRFTDEPHIIAVLLSILSIVSAASNVPFLYKSRRYSMLETESVAWISGRKLLLIRTLMISVCDLMLAVVLLITALLKCVTFEWILLFSTVLPCLSTLTVLLYFVRKNDLLSVERKFWCVCGILCLGFVLLYSRVLPGWIDIAQAVLAIGLIVACVIQIREGFASDKGTIFA